MEDLISPLQFKSKRLFIARSIYGCTKFIVRLNEKCFNLPRDALQQLESFLIEGARNFLWVLRGILKISLTYLPNAVKSESSPESTLKICEWVMELSEAVTKHLLNFELEVFNNCWLLITLKNTSRYWVLRCNEAARVFNI